MSHSQNLKLRTSHGLGYHDFYAKTNAHSCFFNQDLWISLRHQSQSIVIYILLKSKNLKIILTSITFFVRVPHNFLIVFGKTIIITCNFVERIERNYIGYVTQLMLHSSKNYWRFSSKKVRRREFTWPWKMYT